MKVYGLALLILFSFSNSFADERFNEVAKQLGQLQIETDKVVLEDSYKVAAAAASSLNETGFVKMSGQFNKNAAILTCFVIHGGVVGSARVGVCLDVESQRVYKLVGAGLGVTVNPLGRLAFGAKASVLFGVARKNSAGEISGSYIVGSIGGAGRLPLQILSKLKSVSVGLGIDAIIGENPVDKSELYLIGPALGQMLDLSAQQITLF